MGLIIAPPCLLIPQAALNAGTSVEEVGLYGPCGERLWCRTGTETLQLWEWALAAQEDAPGGDMALLDLPGARQDAAAAAAAGGGPSAQLFAQVDYLVGCHWDAASSQLLLMAGTAQGVAGFFPVREPQQGGPCAAGGSPLAPPVVVLRGGHSTVVRSVHCFAAGSSALCVSGGEDSKVCLWSASSASTSAAAGTGSGASSGSSNGPMRPRVPHAARRHSPY